MKSDAVLNFLKTNRNILLVVVAVAGILTGSIVLNIARSNNPNSSTRPYSNTDQLIQIGRSRLAADPGNPSRYVSLCQLYLQKVRENADTSLYEKCDSLLGKATGLDTANADIAATQASVAYGRHSFREGLELSKKALQLNPLPVAYWGLVGDGQIELGQYNEAVQSFQTMVDKKPELSSFNRVAYVREVYGDIAGAKSALGAAISAGSSFPENVAFSQVELGKLHARSDLDKAERTYKEALQTYPSYPPALEGLGRVAFARGDHKEAIKYFSQAFEILPLAQYVSALGDVYTGKGDKKKASQQYFLAQLAFDKSSSGGVNNDFELSTFLSERNKDPKKSLELAQAAFAVRPNIFSADALSWAHYRLGNYTEAQAASREAMKLGEHQAVVLYHAGMIADKLGQKEQADKYLKKAFGLDKYFLESHFSILDRQVAKEALERL
ncbi:tetratricopeptide repeat protein [Candidatus Saccharibacteria bacterium]|nr:tetratricopeptide repeat protein [Candidatus Saccharibacteria bacterium]